MATIKELRQKCGITQQQFASELGKGLNTIRGWEAGVRSPSDKDIPKIAEVLGCSIKAIDVSARKTRQPVTVIGKLRLERGLSMQQLATAVGKSASTVRLWEIGGSKPSDKEFPKLAQALGCSVEDIRAATEQEELNLTAIGKLRIERGLTTKQLAAAVGKSTGTVFGWERGSSRPSDEDFPKIAEVLGCCVEDIWIAPCQEKQELNAMGKLRMERGLTRKQLAAAVGKSETAVLEWENGNRRPADEDFPRLAKALGCSVADIWIPPKTASKRTRQQSTQSTEEKDANKGKSAPYIERRKALGLSQKALAEKSGVGHGTIKDMESGKSFPRWETRQKLRRALGMPEERYFSTEERNALFLAFYEKGYIEAVINQNLAYLRDNNADLDDLRGELAVCALRAIERHDPTGAAGVNGFVYKTLNFFIKNYVLKIRHDQSLESLWEDGFDFES